MVRRLFRKAVQQGRSKRRGESYSPPNVEPLSVARTKLGERRVLARRGWAGEKRDFVNSLLTGRVDAVMTKEVLDPGKVVAIHDFLTREECAALIRRSESFIYEPGTVADVIVEQVRNNERVLVDDVSLASDLFNRAKPLLPAVIEGHGLVGFNERWRFYRYGQGRPSSLIVTGHICG